MQQNKERGGQDPNPDPLTGRGGARSVWKRLPGRNRSAVSQSLDVQGQRLRQTERIHLRNGRGDGLGRAGVCGARGGEKPP